jgi:hypothetical protein
MPTLVEGNINIMFLNNSNSKYYIHINILKAHNNFMTLYQRSELLLLFQFFPVLKQLRISPGKHMGRDEE